MLTVGGRILWCVLFSLYGVRGRRVDGCWSCAHRVKANFQPAAAVAADDPV